MPRIGPELRRPFTTPNAISPSKRKASHHQDFSSTRPGADHRVAIDGARARTRRPSRRASQPRLPSPLKASPLWTPQPSALQPSPQLPSPLRPPLPPALRALLASLTARTALANGRDLRCGRDGDLALIARQHEREAAVRPQDEGQDTGAVDTIGTPMRQDSALPSLYPMKPLPPQFAVCWLGDRWLAVAPDRWTLAAGADVSARRTDASMVAACPRFAMCRRSRRCRRRRHLQAPQRRPAACRGRWLGRRGGNSAREQEQVLLGSVPSDPPVDPRPCLRGPAPKIDA